jgi:hypothetical protein
MRDEEHSSRGFAALLLFDPGGSNVAYTGPQLQPTSFVMTFARVYIIGLPIWAISYAVVGLLGLPSDPAALLLIVIASTVSSAVYGLLYVRGYLS